MAHEASSKRDRDEAHLQGHWLLAKLGKKVLRPGGKKLTNWMIDNANPTNKRVVEFAPGLGITAAEILDRNPKTYTGVDQDPDAATATTLSTKQARLGIPTEVINGVASDTGLPAGSADLVVGEAMLTMQGEKGKAAIVSEANRILATGGRYAIHELLLTPNNVDQTVADNLRKALATTIKVNARPLTATEWSELLENNGFKVLSIKVAPMGLLQPKQMIEDEGPRVLKIMFNLARNPQARKRVLAMRKVFSENAQNLGAISIIAEKISDVKPAETAASEAPEPEASPKVTESKPQDSKPAADDPKANDSKAETPSKPAAPNEAAAPSKTAADKVVEPSKAETAKTTAPKATAHKATSTTAETEAAAPKVEASKKAEATPANSAQAGADTSKKPEDKKPEAAQDATPKKAVPKPHDPRTRNKKS
ncbi:class I SAM-dependent methyltransferase [Corynebacterium matruchotii]|jgi:methyltransferase domain protein|uniref:Methyltransferase domain protein n=2 Tax=Corynebacterium matruchotii TaxID=43768 RepID=E0DCU2_9CORY|nr:class I SAM-dependent methyltransferase [Corynebacterium matruchotii]EFM49748.1 methyltransferase domain protein [Corynebacterium matruchotii ATCC 14266]KAB1924780.1 methyltransferase domain-containing protein [Corynebacterium matruchotii]QIP45732.1 methyltransferase domain-containing protein [Corynebacterium matruchotii]SPW23964.1 SAM-dependent methyltransferase [Corynebacterium matruchotii]VEI98072.1 SAM-dependent methyltransferase [Corynebacterium matruchotii]